MNVLEVWRTVFCLLLSLEAAPTGVFEKHDSGDTRNIVGKLVWEMTNRFQMQY